MEMKRNSKTPTQLFRLAFLKLWLPENRKPALREKGVAQRGL